MNRLKRLFLFAAILILAASFSGCGGGNGSNPPPPSDQKPAIAISPTTATVELGKSQSFTLALSGQPSPTVTCSQPTQGTVSNSGNAVTYTAPADPPAQNWTVNISCTAQNRAGSATATAQITLNYPVPVIDSINSSSIYLSKEMIIGGIEVRGSGFYAGGTFQVHNPDSPFAGSVILAQGTERNKLSWNTAFDTPHWAPMYLKITVSSPTGHGGGTSNPGWFAFLGNLNALALSQTKAFFLYLGPVPGGEAGIGDRIRVYDLATGAQVADFSIDSPSFVRQIAYEEVNSLILNTGYQAMGVWREDGSIKNAIGNDDNARPMSISSLEGNVCATFPTTGKIGWVTGLDLFSPPPFTIMPTGHKPWNVAVSKLGDQLLCTVYDIQDLQLSVIKIPQLELHKSLILNGLTPADQLWGQGDGPDGGWQLDVFKSGSAANTAAVLSQTVIGQFDRVIVFVDIASGTELRRVQLDGNPFRIAANNATGELIVAYADTSDGKTHFKKIAVSTGEVTNLSMTTPEGVLATGLAVSSDGTKVYAAGYNPSGQPTFTILPIN
jgi:hypothetical protein